MLTAQTEIVRASEMYEKVFRRIWDIRTGAERQRIRDEYERELAAYTKAKGKRKEVTEKRTVKEDIFRTAALEYGRLKTAEAVGYWKRDASTQSGVRFVPRPVAPTIKDDSPSAFTWGNESKRVIGGHVYPRRTNGLLANSEHNRDLRPDRVQKYTIEMGEGKWRDLLSDPIAITVDGQVLNGQHRLAAVWDCLYERPYLGYGRHGYGEPRGMSGTDPAFLVVWGIDPEEALYTDGSHRTAHDQKTIAVKLVKGAAA